MDIGLLLNSQAAADTSPRRLVDEMITHTRAARDAGFDLVSSGQHYLTECHQVQPLPILSRLTDVAGPMTVATGVILLPLHHPVAIAEQVSTLTLLARETVLGVGAGYRDIEFECFGIPKAERGPRLAEGIELIRRLWTEETVTYHGEYYAVEDVSIHPRPPAKPAIWVAANAGPAIQRAAKLGDAWYVNPHATLAEIATQKRAYDDIRARVSKDTGVPFSGRGSLPRRPSAPSRRPGPP